ncbi:MAG: hypothetical protein IJC46_09590 [Clostridia bacterium]|nr:hypothetical protein [Clostridia bacterium]
MKERTKSLIALSLLGIGVIALTLGLLRGEAAEILKKATIICLECIGIG